MQRARQQLSESMKSDRDKRKTSDMSWKSHSAKLKNFSIRSGKASVAPCPEDTSSTSSASMKLPKLTESRIAKLRVPNTEDDQGSEHLSWIHDVPQRIATQKRMEIQDEIERTRKRVDEIYRNVDFRVNPSTKVMRSWNALIFLTLVFTATWTPFEVSFLKIGIDGRFVLNRFIDTFLIVDFFLQFVTCYQDPVTGVWIRDSKSIFIHYASGRLIFDALASFGCLIFDMTALYGTFHTSGADDGGIHTNELLATGRLLRLLSLIRFPKLSSDTFEYFHFLRGDQWTYNRLSLLKFLFIILSLVHWMACVWRLITKFEQHTDNNFQETWIVREDLLSADPVDQYVVCVYWASTTITTIGYGDIANPGTELERFIAVLTMLMGALVWARIIGGITSIVSAFNIQDLEFSEQMDRLNAYMESKHMPTDLRHRLRRYFRARRQMEQDNSYASLLEKMSPALRGEVARTVSREWLARVPWLNVGSLGFIASVAIALEHELYAPKELIMGSQLRVLTRGVVARNSRIFTRGSVWGIDMIVASDALRDKKPSRALTYAQVLCLQQDALEELLEVYPHERARIRATALWIALRKSFTKYAAKLRIGRKVMHQIASDADRLGVDVAEVFKKHDMRGRDELNEEEFLSALRVLGYCGPASLITVMISRFDKNGDGSVDYREFVSYFMRDFANERMSMVSEDVRKRHEHKGFVDRAQMLALREQQIFAKGEPLGQGYENLPILESEIEEEQQDMVSRMPSARSELSRDVMHRSQRGQESWFSDDDDDHAHNIVVVQRKKTATGKIKGAARPAEPSHAGNGGGYSQSAYRGNVVRTQAMNPQSHQGSPNSTAPAKVNSPVESEQQRSMSANTNMITMSLFEKDANSRRFSPSFRADSLFIENQSSALQSFRGQSSPVLSMTGEEVEALMEKKLAGFQNEILENMKRLLSGPQVQTQTPRAGMLQSSVNGDGEYVSLTQDVAMDHSLPSDCP